MRFKVQRAHGHEFGTRDVENIQDLKDILDDYKKGEFSIEKDFYFRPNDVFSLIVSFADGEFIKEPTITIYDAYIE